MTTRQPLCRVIVLLPLFLAIFMLSARPANSAFVPFDMGNWQYEAPGDVTIAETPGRVTKTFGLTLTTTFTDLNEKVITFRTTPGHNEDERFFMFDMNITNGLPVGNDFSGFIIKTLDQIEVGPNTPANPPQAHPKWAHIHPRHSSPNPSAVPVPGAPTGPDYAQFTLLDPDESYGVEVLTLLGEAVPVGDTWMPRRVRLHDKNALGDLFVSSDEHSFDQIGPMEFKLALEPLIFVSSVPEPDTFTLMMSSLAIMVAVACRRRRAR